MNAQPRRLEAEAMRYGRDHDWDGLAWCLARLRELAERDHPIVTDVLTRTPPERQPIEPSDPE